MSTAQVAVAAGIESRPEPGDLSRERKGFWEWAPSRSLLASIRSYQRWRGKWYGLPFAKLAVLRHRFWSVVTAADIPLNSRLGLGLLIPHPTGIVIHPNAEIGPNCLILSGVTIGSRGREHPGVPKLGAHVDVGTGAKILGPVRIGARAVIGANAVVVKDVRAGARVVGVPGREVGFEEIASSPDWVHGQHQAPSQIGFEGMCLDGCAVLDIGCGTGKDFRHPIYANARCFGIDPSQDHIMMGRTLYPHVDLRVGVAESLPYEDEQFDFVVSRVALLYSQIPVAFAQISRVMKPGARLLLTMHDWRMELRWIRNAIRERSVKGLARRAYVIIATLGFLMTGWVMPQPWGKGRESFQTERSLRKSLINAGFTDVRFERSPRDWIIKARRR